jgi:hypothetical protein
MVKNRNLECSPAGPPGSPKFGPLRQGFRRRLTAVQPPVPPPLAAAGIAKRPPTIPTNAAPV